MTYPTREKDNNLYRAFGKKYKEGVHRGKDIGCPEGTDVFSAYSGEVVKSGFYNGYGSLNPSTKGGAIWIKHIDTNNKVFYTHYGHVKLLVQTGQIVDEGNIIGKVAGFKNGSDYLPHLHFGKLNSDIIPDNNWGYGNDIGDFVDPLK